MGLAVSKALAWALVTSFFLSGNGQDDVEADPAVEPQVTEREPVWRDPPDLPRPRPDRDYLPFLIEFTTPNGRKPSA